MRCLLRVNSVNKKTCFGRRFFIEKTLKLNKESRGIFIQRYWYAKSIKDISRGFNVSESKVKMQLSRNRRKLRKILEKENMFHER